LVEPIIGEDRKMHHVKCKICIEVECWKNLGAKVGWALKS
jgi:hypothetical protein